MRDNSCYHVGEPLENHHPAANDALQTHTLHVGLQNRVHEIRWSIVEISSRFRYLCWPALAIHSLQCPSSSTNFDLALSTSWSVQLPLPGSNLSCRETCRHWTTSQKSNRREKNGSPHKFVQVLTLCNHIDAPGCEKTHKYPRTIGPRLPAWYKRNMKENVRNQLWSWRRWFAPEQRLQLYGSIFHFGFFPTLPVCPDLPSAGQDGTSIHLI